MFVCWLAVGLFLPVPFTGNFILQGEWGTPCTYPAASQLCSRLWNVSKMVPAIIQTKETAWRRSNRATRGNHKFTSQTNHSADCVPVEDRFKWVDDLTILERINFVNIKIWTYNIIQPVASDLPPHGQFIDSKDLKTQQNPFLFQINQWTKNNKCILTQNKNLNQFYKEVIHSQTYKRINQNSRTNRNYRFSDCSLSRDRAKDAGQSPQSVKDKLVVSTECLSATW